MIEIDGRSPGAASVLRASDGRAADEPLLSVTGVLDLQGRATSDAGFDDFYATHFNKLTMQLYAYTGDLAQAQDVVQEAFCRALQRWQRLTSYDDPVAWVRRVAWNLATNRWRQLRRHYAFLQRQREQHVPAPSPDHVAITAALAALPDNQRRAVVMFYLADMPVSEIAKQQGVPDGTVKSWLHRGRITLAAALTEQRGESTHV